MIWFDNFFTENPDIKILGFARLVFGLSSSPFVLNITVKIHLEKFMNDAQKRKVIIKLLRDLYIDDVMSSINDAKEGIKFYETSKSCLLSGKFDLRKCVTNNENLQTFINSKEHSINPPSIIDKTWKVLGLNWSTKNDEFIYDMKGIVDLAEELKPTKRNILKISAMFYDPLRWIAPIILQSKLIFHEICVAKYDWDTEVSHEYILLWNKFIKGLKMLEGVSVRHHIL